MQNKSIVLEISHKYIKIVIGSTINDQLCVNYVKKVPIHHLLENGIIRDKVTLINELSKLNPILDNEYHINQMLDNVVLVLPPYGVEIYKTQQLTSVISPDKTIGKLDIKNIYSIIRNKKLPNENDLIDIIIDSFMTDSGERYASAPIGTTSGAITAFAKVHTLPKRINDEFTRVVNTAGIKIAQKVISSFGAVELLKIDPNIPNNYFLVDVGANSTTVSLIGNKELVATRSFSWGGDILTEKIIEKYNINEIDAEKAKKLFGYDKREMKFDYPIIETKQDENVQSYHREEINATMIGELEKFSSLLVSTIEQLTSSYNVTGEKLPILLIGGSSKLHGFVEFLREKLSNDNINNIIPKVIGARDPSLFAALGAIIVNEKYLVDADSTSVINVLREE